MLTLFEKAKENPQARPALFRDGGEFHPVGLLRSDNGADQSVKSVPAQLALWQFFKKADLDVLEKGGFCPGHSKMNPAELVNQAVKNCLMGLNIPSGAGQLEIFREAGKPTKALIDGKTYAGETITVDVMEKENLDSLGLYNSEQLDGFVEARRKVLGTTLSAKTDSVPLGPSQIQKWRESGMQTYAELLQALWRHVGEDQGVYLITIARCQLQTNDEAEISACADCRGRELRADHELLRLFVSKEGPPCHAGEGGRGGQSVRQWGRGLRMGAQEAPQLTGNEQNFWERREQGCGNGMCNHATLRGTRRPGK